MKLVQILFFLLLLYGQYSYADSDLNLPNLGKLNISLNQVDCFDVLCDTSLNISWKTKGKSSSQQLLKDDYPRIYKVFSDKDGLIVSSFGNRYEPDEYRYYERYRYSQEKNIFYKAETWETDDWTGYIAELDRLLKIGAFTKARQLVSEKGVTPNGGHTYQDEEIFSKFVGAIYREAKRAKKLGYEEVAGELTLSLFSMPFWHGGAPDTDDFYIFSGVGEEKLRSNILAANTKNTVLINDFSIFLSNSGFNKKSIFLLHQVTRYSPETTTIWKSLGDVYLLSNQQDKAIKAYNMYYDLMKEKGLDGVVSEKVLHLINKKQAVGLNTQVENSHNNQADIAKIVWYDGYISEYPIKAKVVFNNGVIQQLSYAYNKTKKWIDLSNLKYNDKGIFQAVEKEKEKTTGFWELNFQRKGNIKGNWESPIGEILPILLEPKSKLAKSINVSAPNDELSKSILIDVNYDGYLDLVKSDPTLRKGSTTKKYYSHSVYLFDKKIKEYKFIKDLSYFSYDVYMNIENYDLFNKSFRACNRSRKNPKRARKCWNFYTTNNINDLKKPDKTKQIKAAPQTKLEPPKPAKVTKQELETTPPKSADVSQTNPAEKTKPIKKATGSISLAFLSSMLGLLAWRLS